MASRRRRRGGQLAVSHVEAGTHAGRPARFSLASRCPALSPSGRRRRGQRAPRRSRLPRRSRSGETRRIPFWSRVTASLLVRHSARPLTRTGTYRGTRGTPRARVHRSLPGKPDRERRSQSAARPRADLPRAPARPAANVGVVILERGRGVRVQPIIVLGRDENRQAGPNCVFPLKTNPYLPTFGQLPAVPAGDPPGPGTYDVVLQTARPGVEPDRSSSATGSATRPRPGFARSRGRSGATER